MLYREPKLLKSLSEPQTARVGRKVSVLYREPKLLKSLQQQPIRRVETVVSVLYREPKLLKSRLFGDLTGFLIFTFQCSTVSRNC